MRLLDSFIVMYMVQTVVHSVVTLLIVEMALRIWQVGGAHERFRYRLQVILLPFFMYPFFQLINPGRSSFYFGEDTALFSSARWLRIDLFGKIPLFFPFLLVLGVVSAIVILQEVVPVAGNLLSREGMPEGKEGCLMCAEVDGLIDDMSTRLKIDRPVVLVIEDDNPVIFTAGTRTHAIVLSETLLNLLDRRQLRGALAHELAHILRRSNFTTLLVFLVRICMFYNPISLLEFRRLVQDDEHICDDITVSLTRDPGGLASALKVFCLDGPLKEELRIAQLPQALESSSHNMLLQERIARLEGKEIMDYYPMRWGRYFLTIAAIVALNYFVI